MVYHPPGQEPLGNRVWLGPLRLLTCDEAAAQLPRRLVLMIGGYLTFAFGLGKIVEQLLPHVPPAERLVELLKTDDKTVAQRVVRAGIVYAGYRFVKYLFSKWRDHMWYIPPKNRKFFYTSYQDKIGDSTYSDPKVPDGAVGVVFYKKPEGLPDNATPKDVKGVLANKKWNRWYAWPILSQDQGMIRGFNFVGMKLLPFLFMEATIGFEYPMTSLSRIIQHYCWIPKWNKPKPDRNLIYHAILNTSYFCFIDFDTKSPTYGHCVIENLLLPYLQTSMREYKSLIFHLDHDREILLKVTITYEGNDKIDVTETYGSLDDTENTYNLDAKRTKDGIVITPYQNLEQAANILSMSLSLYSHAIVHWWANGTAVLPDGVWAAKALSTNITQWMNTQAVFLSWLFFGNSQTTFETILVQNNAQGLSYHGGPGGVTNLQKALGAKSKFHQMSYRTREFLVQQLGKSAESPNIPEVDAILAATVMHSAEHYYAGKLLPLFGTNGSILALKSDMSGLVMSLITPIAYWTRRLLVRQHSDPISQGIYNICKDVDPDFAYNALSVGCAF